MKKYVYISILSIFLLMIYAGVNLINGSYAIGSYTFLNRYKSSVTFKIPGVRTSSTMGYFTLKNSENDKVTGFCGSYGKSVWNGTNKTYTRYDLNSYFNYKSNDWLTKVRNIVLLYSPDISSNSTTALNNLKSYLQTNYGELYASKGLANLTVAETTSTFQAAIWYFTDNQNWQYYQTGVRYDRIMALYDILLQNKYGYLPNITTYTGTINFTVNSNLAWEGTNIVTTIGPSVGTTFDYTKDTYSIVFKTNTGITINSDNYTAAYDETTKGMKYTLTGITQDGESHLIYDGKVFDTLVATINATSSTMVGKKGYVYAPDTKNNYQIYLGGETSNVSVRKVLTLPAPELQRVSIKFNKVDLNNLNGSNLEGAYLKLYRVDNTTRVLIKEWATGLAYYEVTDLIPGTYVIEETITPKGYKTVNNYINNDTAHNTLYVSSDKTFNINNTINTVNVVNEKTKVSILKTDLSNNNIKGVKFNIIDRNGDIYYTFTTSETAVSISGELETGVYFLEEIEAPTNFRKSDDLYRFTVGTIDDSELVNGKLPGLSSDVDIIHPDKMYGEKKIVDITLTNNTATLTNRRGIVITKRDIANNNLYVIGATLTITKRGTTEVVETWETTNEEHVVFLEDGDYTLTETVTPGGYSTAESIDFTILNGAVTNNTDLNMKDSRLNVCIAKKAMNVLGNLAGAKFEVYNDRDELVASFTSDMDEYCFNDDITKAVSNTKIKPGTYTIKEILSPRGYKAKNIETTMEIRDTSELQLFEIYNEVDVPRTSLDVSKMIYIAAIVLGSFGIGIIVYYAKKYNY